MFVCAKRGVYWSTLTALFKYGKLVKFVSYFVHSGATTGNERMRVMSDCLQTKGNTAILPVFWFLDKMVSNGIK